MKKYNNIIKKSKYSPCSVNNRSLCCKQSVISSPTFKSQQINKSYTIFHKVKCSSGYGIYLMECAFCKKQYVGKSGTSFNIRLNNHCKDLKKTWCHISVQTLPRKKPSLQQTRKGHHYRQTYKYQQIKRNFAPKIDWKRKFLDSNAANTTLKRTESRA